MSLEILPTDIIKKLAVSAMYTENSIRDMKLFVTAAISNQLARFFPSLYVRLTEQTGRGRDDVKPRQVADYYVSSFLEYFQRLGITDNHIPVFLQGKSVLEYGPGDILGTALLFYAHGASVVHCVDRFPLRQLTANNLDVYRKLLESLDDEKRERASRAFIEYGKPESGFKPSVIEYFVTRDGLIGQPGRYDLIVSRAVLEHVNRLDETLADIAQALKADGVSIHQVDLKSHNLDRYQAFDFLTWPDLAYDLMYSHKGFPNRWRVNKYRDSAYNAGLTIVSLVPTAVLDLEKIAHIRPKLPAKFRDIPSEELAWLGFWIIIKHPAVEVTKPAEIAA